MAIVRHTNVNKSRLFQGYANDSLYAPGKALECMAGSRYSNEPSAGLDGKKRQALRTNVFRETWATGCDGITKYIRSSCVQTVLIEDQHLF